MTNCFTANPRFIFPVILNLFQDLISGLGRIPVDYLLGAVEGIDILSDVANGENIFETTAKSATNLLGSITLSGYCGALGSKMFGITGSMLGTGIGNFANNKLNNMLFD